MVKVYPPFVNYFEMTKETVVRCDRDIPRFHAFLKVIGLAFGSCTQIVIFSSLVSSSGHFNLFATLLQLLVIR